MYRIIEDIVFLEKYLFDEPTKQREAWERLKQFISGERIFVSDDCKKCFKNPLIKLGPDDF